MADYRQCAARCQYTASIALHQSAACPCGLVARYPYGFFISGIHGTGFSEHDDGERATGFRRMASRSLALCFWALDVDTPELRQAVSRAECHLSGLLLDDYRRQPHVTLDLCGFRPPRRAMPTSSRSPG
jgi:hypothetical protein